VVNAVYFFGGVVLGILNDKLNYSTRRLKKGQEETFLAFGYGSGVVVG